MPLLQLQRRLLLQSRKQLLRSQDSFKQKENCSRFFFIKENISFNSSHSWLGHMQPSRKKQAFNKKASTGFISSFLKSLFTRAETIESPSGQGIESERIAISLFPFPGYFSPFPWAGLRKNWNAFLHWLLSATWDVGTYLFVDRIFPGFRSHPLIDGVCLSFRLSREKRNVARLTY